ncbi:MAG: sulfatase-like hydrolase/transferase, partial [Niameybacter sp.]
MKKRKNVILILSDQQRYDTVSAYRLNDICKTPRIDALAEEGMKFTNAFTSSAICAPARASVMTGLYPH